jgi:hypothetical protein
MASLIIWSTYVSLVEMMVVSSSLMRWHMLILCSATADLSGYSRRMCLWCSLILVSAEGAICQT